MPGGLGVVVGRAGDFTGELFKGLALRLGDQEGGEDSAKHKEGENLHDVVDPRGRVVFGRVALGLEGAEHALGDDGADLAGGGRETVRGGPVACRETFAGHDEGGGVGAEVEEELSNDVEGEQATLVQFVVGEADDDKDDGEDGEAHELDGLAADGVNRRHRDPVAWDGAGADNDQIADGGVVEDLIHVVTLGVANGGQNDGVVEPETVESNVEEEPGASGSKQDLSVLPLRVVSPEIGPRGLPQSQQRNIDHGEREREGGKPTLGAARRARESWSTAARLTSSGWPSALPLLYALTSSTAFSESRATSKV